MSNSDIAIKVENLSKYYRLGVINNGTLFRDIQSWAARKRGREDPHAKIGSKYDPTEEGFWALKDVNFEIKKGDRVGIIGHNGAGKSTLLKILSQITAPTEGCLKINGRISSLLEVGTGFHSELTGRENIFMNGAILGMKHSEIDSKINEIIEFSEIGDYIDTPVKRYSSGMYVRLAFAVAAHLDSDILIADEVLAVGDAAFQKKALGKMNELSTGQGRTVLFVSHNMSQVKRLCNTGYVLDKGAVIYSGDIQESIATYYAGNGNIRDIKIIDKAQNFFKTFHLKKVVINGSENCKLVVPASCKNLKFSFEGSTDVPQELDVMVVFKNAEGVPLATYSLGHQKGITMKLNDGEFNFSTIIDIPEYVGKGTCILNIILHVPGVIGIVDINDAVTLTFEGSAAAKNPLQISASGFLGLEGHNE